MARTTAPVGTPIPYKDGWHVMSSTGYGPYFVRLQPHPSCTCPGYVYSKGWPKSPCRHIRACQALVAQKGGADAR